MVSLMSEAVQRIEAETAQASYSIEVCHLSIGAGDDRVVLHDLDFQVGQGDVFIIMGPSGCGKSVLMRNLVGLEEPLSGDVFYHGCNFTQAISEDRRRILSKLGVLFQSPALFSSMTLIENVALPI